VIEVLAESLPGGANIATEVPLSEHAVKVGLRESQPPMNEFAHVLALPGFWVARDPETRKRYNHFCSL
jgi:hypothetical protein